jgi:hypothetical protein
LQFSLRRAFHHGLLVSANYMWAHAIDNGAIGGGEADAPENIKCRSCERSSGDQDVRHSVNFNAVYRLPVGTGTPFLSGYGWFSRALSGWELSGLISARTGVPVNITVSTPASALPDGNNSSAQRPDLVAGASLIPASGQTVNNWINLSAFAVPLSGTWGNLGRNAVRGPDLWQADTALGKDVRLAEKAHLTLRADVFNLFNRAQYGNPSSNISAPSTFGTILSPINTDATGTARHGSFSSPRACGSETSATIKP